MDQNYGGVIWTNHALDRMKERGVSQGDAWYTFQRPDQTRYAKANGAWVYYRSYPGEKIEVVAKKDKFGKWIILSVWSKKLRRKYDKKSFNFWDSLRRLFHL